MILAYLRPEPSSRKETLNTNEIGRIVIVAIYAGLLVFSVCYGTGNPFPAPSDAGLAAFVLTTILETRRRLSHEAPK